jgi:hypothetical protein
MPEQGNIPTDPSLSPQNNAVDTGGYDVLSSQHILHSIPGGGDSIDRFVKDTENPSGSELTKQDPSVNKGAISIVNPYALLVFPSLEGNYNRIIDSANSPDKFLDSKRLEVSVTNLVNNPPDGKDDIHTRMPYRYTDFLYCKYYGQIPNNYLVTLRRFPAPTYDNLEIPSQSAVIKDAKDNVVSHNVSPEDKDRGFKPIAQAVTWLGEETENPLAEILGFDVNINWKSFEAEVNTVQGNEQSNTDGPPIFSGAGKFLAIINGDVNTPFAEKNSQYDPYSTGPYSHRVYGPVNVINKTYKRDRGLDFKQSFDLNFHYSLKSIGSINPKAAMLDIMQNMLQLTYSNAAFWGGANRYFPQRPMYPFIGGAAGMNAWYRGDPVAFSRVVGDQITQAAKTISDFLSDLAADPLAALKQIAAGALKLGMGAMSQGRAPDIVGIKSLLTGEPIGEWHVVIGNPYAPIAMMGNMICTGAKFKFNDMLGADDFPTEMKVTISMEHGRPRDMGDIASIFNNGNGRIYVAPDGNPDIFQTSSNFNSRNDTSYKKGNASLVNGSANANTSGKVDIFRSNPEELTGSVGNSYKALQDSGHLLALKMGLLSAGPGALSSDTYQNNVPKP